MRHPPNMAFWATLLVASALDVSTSARAQAPSPSGSDATPRLAIKGYDPVAYFTPGRPMPGSSAITLDWDGARWQFADADHRELFRKDPDAYAPQYGGYCALGMAINGRGEIDPEAWAIVDGKLYLTFDQQSLAEWRQDQAASIAAADQAWAAARR